jgi:hypothetical protein
MPKTQPEQYGEHCRTNYLLSRGATTGRRAHWLTASLVRVAIAMVSKMLVWGPLNMV